MSVIDFRTPAAGFDQPLQLWSACHDRVRRMASLLERLVEHLAENGSDDAAQVTASAVLRYFDEAAPRHHEDEEIDLFPLLRRVMPSRAPAEAESVLSALDRLGSDHVALGALWQQLRLQLKAIEAGNAASLDRASVERFASGYRQHCEIEDSLIAGALEECLADIDLDALGQAMAERRGIDWTHLHSSRAPAR